MAFEHNYWTLDDYTKTREDVKRRTAELKALREKEDAETVEAMTDDINDKKEKDDETDRRA